MTRTSNTTTATVDPSIATAAETFTGLVNDMNVDRAKVVLKDFIRKEDERNKSIASINNYISELEGKLAKASKVSNQAALTRKIAVSNAELTEVVTLKEAAATKRDAFIAAFDSDPYAALANSSLVREEIADKIA